MELGETIGKVISAERHRMGLTQVELAFRAGIDPMTISRIERGKYLPSLTVFRLLADAMDYQSSQLLKKIEAFEEDQIAE